MIKSLIFDFDGTLGDTRANIVLTMTQTLKTMGYPVAGENEIASTLIGFNRDPFTVLQIIDGNLLTLKLFWREIAYQVYSIRSADPREREFPSLHDLLFRDRR